MAHPDLIIDTSIFIDHLRKRNKRKSALFNIVDDYVLYTPAVVEFELFAGAIDPQKLDDVHYLLQFCTGLSMTSEVARHAGRLHQDLKQRNMAIEIRDLFIASTAIVHGFPLMTLNTRHFQRIESLEILEPPGS